MFINRVIFYKYIGAELLLIGLGGFSGSSIIPVIGLGSFSSRVRGLGNKALFS